MSEELQYVRVSTMHDDYQLVNDPELFTRHICIRAETYKYLEGSEAGKIVNNIKFVQEVDPQDFEGDIIPREVESRVNKYGQKIYERVAKINCIHTALFSVEVEDGQNLGDLANQALEMKVISSERKEVSLSHEDHFFSLKSYVEGIAEYGVLNMIKDAATNPQYDELRFGFNPETERQFISALAIMAADLITSMMEEWLIRLHDSNPEWLDNRYPVLESRLPFAMLISPKDDPDCQKFEMYLDFFPSHKVEMIRHMMFRNTKSTKIARMLTAKVWEIARQDPGRRLNYASAMEKWIGCLEVEREFLEELAKNKLPSIRAGVALNWHAPQTVLFPLAYDNSHYVRWRLASNDHIDAKLMLVLVRQHDKRINRILKYNQFHAFYRNCMQGASKHCCMPPVAEGRRCEFCDTTKKITYQIDVGNVPRVACRNCLEDLIFSLDPAHTLCQDCKFCNTNECGNAACIYEYVKDKSSNPKYSHVVKIKCCLRVIRAILTPDELNEVLRIRLPESKKRRY